MRRLTLEDENPRHTQLLEFIDTLRPVSALLLIGQQSVLESDLVVTDGLATWAKPGGYASRPFHIQQRVGRVAFLCPGQSPAALNFAWHSHAAVVQRLATPSTTVTVARSLSPLVTPPTPTQRAGAASACPACHLS
ncbi:MAG: hypothetical protein U0175_13570 [Caldilineaceae bacterium]